MPKLYFCHTCEKVRDIAKLQKIIKKYSDYELTILLKKYDKPDVNDFKNIKCNFFGESQFNICSKDSFESKNIYLIKGIEFYNQETVNNIFDVLLKENNKDIFFILSYNLTEEILDRVNKHDCKIYLDNNIYQFNNNILIKNTFNFDPNTQGKLNANTKMAKYKYIAPKENNESKQNNKPKILNKRIIPENCHANIIGRECQKFHANYIMDKFLEYLNNKDKHMTIDNNKFKFPWIGMKPALITSDIINDFKIIFASAGWDIEIKNNEIRLVSLLTIDKILE